MVYATISKIGDEMIRKKLLSLLYEIDPNHHSKAKLIQELKDKIRKLGGEIE